jgi:hypothetical protein
VDDHILRRKAKRRFITERHPSGLDKFIAFATLIRLLQSILCAHRVLIAAENDAVDGGGGSLPPRVAVHAVVATSDGSDLS